MDLSSKLGREEADYSVCEAGKYLNPITAFGLCTRSNRGCVVPHEASQVIHIAGTLLVLQSVDDPGKSTVLPGNENVCHISGLCMHQESQVLAICSSDHEGIWHLAFYNTKGLHLDSNDLWSCFRRIRNLVIPPREVKQDPMRATNDPFPFSQSESLSKTQETTNMTDQSPLPSRITSGSSNSSEASTPTPPPVMAFSKDGQKFLLALEGIIHHVDWPRSRFTFHYIYASPLITSICFDPSDDSRLSVSGKGFLKIWWVKPKSIAPIRDIVGLDLNGKTIVDHFWLPDVGGTLVGIAKEGYFYCVDVTRSKQQILPCILGREGQEPRALSMINSQTVAVVGDRGRVAILQEIVNDQDKEGCSHGTTTASSASTAIERFALVQVVNIAHRPQPLLGIRPLGKDRVLLWSPTYMALVPTLRLLALRKANHGRDVSHSSKQSNRKHSIENGTELRPGSAPALAALSGPPPDSFLPFDDGEEDLASLEVQVFREYHMQSITSMSSAVRKPLLASCTGHELGGRLAVIRVWNYQAHCCLITHYEPSGRTPRSLAFHPSGDQLMAAYDDRLQLYHVLDTRLRLAHVMEIKGLLRLPTTDLTYAIPHVSLVVFNHGGSLLAVITGRVMQVYAFYSNQDGLPARIHILAGHSDIVNSVVWSLDDLRLFSCSQDTILEWHIGTPMPIRQVNLLSGVLGNLALSDNGTLLASHYEPPTVMNSLVHSILIWPGRAIVQDTGPNLLIATKTLPRLSSSARIASAANALPPSSVSRSNLSTPSTPFQPGRKETTFPSPVSWVTPTTASISEPPECLDPSYLTVNLPSETGMITSLTATSITGNETNMGVIENAVVVGTETGVYYLLNLSEYLSQDTKEAIKASDMTSRESQGGHSAQEGNVASRKARAAKRTAAISKELEISEALLKTQHLYRRVLHEGKCTFMCLSYDMDLLFTASCDGTIFKSQLRLFREMDRRKDPEDTECQDVTTPDVALVLAERSFLAEVDARAQQLLFQMAEQQSTANFQLELANQEKERVISSMQNLYATELKSRDLRLKDLEEKKASLEHELMTQMRDMENAYAKGAAELELQYQKKLSGAAIRFERLRTAFDDLVVAAKDDVLEIKTNGSMRERELTGGFDKEKEKNAEEQGLLRGYAEYLKMQFRHIIEKEDQTHDIDVIKLKADVQIEKDKLLDAGAQHQIQQHRLRKEIVMLQNAAAEKEDVFIDMHVKLDRERATSKRLDQQVNEQAEELRQQLQKSQHLERQVAEQAKQLEDLDKITQVVNAELKKVQESVPPKDKEVTSLRQRLQEADHHYIKGLRHQAEVDRQVQEQKSQIRHMQREVVSLRHLHNQKSQILDRLRTEFAAMAYGQVLGTEAVELWRQRLREWLPCAKKALENVESERLSTPQDLLAREQAKQRDFLFRDVQRLKKKLYNWQHNQGHTIELRTQQNSCLMMDMSMLRKQNQKLEWEIRAAAANREDEIRKVRGLQGLLQHMGVNEQLIHKVLNGGSSHQLLSKDRSKVGPQRSKTKRFVNSVHRGNRLGEQQIERVRQTLATLSNHQEPQTSTPIHTTTLNLLPAAPSLAGSMMKIEKQSIKRRTAELEMQIESVKRDNDELRELLMQVAEHLSIDRQIVADRDGEHE